MNYRKLGKSGLKISEVGIGSGIWIPADGKDAEASRIAIRRKAFDLGVNFFDTADVYLDGREEVVLGNAIRQLPRRELVVATKCAGRLGPGPNDRGLSKKHIVESCEGSLRRMGLDYIDLYQFHTPDQETPLEESLAAIELLLRQGKILYWGVSNFSTEQLQELLNTASQAGIPAPVSNQIKYNLFRFAPEETLIPLMKRAGIGLLAYSPLEQGILTGKYRSTADVAPDNRMGMKSSAQALLTDYNFEAVEALRSVAEAAGLSLVQLALAWILRDPPASTVITWTSKPGQLEANLSASGVTLTPAVLMEIAKILKRRLARIKIADFQKDL